MKKVKLKNIASIFSGNGAPQNQSDFSDDGIPFIRAGSLEFLVKGDSIEKCEKINPENAKRLKLTLFPKNSILFAKSGMSAKMGRIYLLEKEAYVVSHLAVITPTKSNVNPLYLKYFFIKNSPSTLIRDAAYPSIRLSDISEWEIELPELLQQNKVASILLKTENLIQKRKQAILILDELFKSVFYDMFGDPVFNKKQFPKIKLGKLGKWMSGGTPLKSEQKYYNGNIPWYSSGELNNVFISESKEYINEIAIKETSAKKVIAGSLLIGMYDTAALKSSITSVDASCNQAIAFSKLSSDKCNSLYVYSAIQIGRNFHLSRRRGARQRNLNLSMIKNLEIPLPSIETQNQFAKIFEKVIYEKEKLNQALEDLVTLFNSLLQKAFRGELEFNEDEYEIQEGIINLSWYQSQLESISKNTAILESVSKIQKVLENNAALQSIANMNKALQQFHLPALQQIENLNKILNRFQVPYLEAISKIEQIEELKVHPALKNLNIEDYYNQSIEEKREEERLKEIEQELKEENDPVLKFISETQIGKATLGSYKVNFPRFIHESFNGEEFTVSEIIERLGSEHALANVKEENVLADIFRLFRVFIKLQFKETAFTFQQLADKLKERLFNPSFEILHRFVSEELKMNSDLVQVYFPGNMQEKYPILYGKLIEEKAQNKLYLVSINGNS